MGPDQRASGWLIDLWKLWSKKTGIKVSFIFAPFSQSLQMVKDGRAHVHAGCFKSQARSVYLDYITPLIDLETHIFHSKSIYGIKRINDLKGFKVGAITGDFAVEYLKEKLPDISLALYPDNKSLFNAIHASDIKVFVKDKPIGLYMLKQQGALYDFHYNVSRPLYSKPFYAAIGKDEYHLLQTIKDGMELISAQERAQIEYQWNRTAYEKSRNTLVISMIKDHKPFAMLNHEGQPAGLLVDIWKLWAQKTNQRIAFNIGKSWQEARQDVIDGHSDIHLGLIANGMGAPDLALSSAIYPVEIYLYFKTGTSLSTDKNMNGLKTGVLQGSAEESRLKAQFGHMNLITYKTMEDLITGLMDGRIDALAGTSAQVNFSLEKLGYSGELDQAPSPLFSAAIKAGVHTDSPDILKLIETGMLKISRDELLKIETRWIHNPQLRLLALGRKHIDLTDAEKKWLSQHNEFRLGIDNVWPPFEYIGPDDEYAGIASDYVKFLSDKLKIKTKVSPGLSWPEVIDGARQKKLDILPCISRTAKRDEFLNFTKPYLTVDEVLVTRNDASYIRGINDLAGGVLATIKGYATQENIARDHPNQELLLVKSIDEGLKAVMDGRALAFVDNLASISYSMKKLGYNELRIADSTGHSYDMTFGVRKDWPELVSILNKVLDTMPESQKKEINNRWINVRFERHIDWHRVWKIVGLISMVGVALLSVIMIWNRKLASEIQERKKTEKALELSEEQYRTVFEHAPLGLVHLDAQGKIVNCNERFLEIMDGTREQFIGFRTLENPMDETIRNAIINTINGERNWFEGDFTSRITGTTKPLRIISNPLKGKSDKSEVIVTFEDITERKTVETQLKQNVDDLERFNRLAVGREEKMIKLKEEINRLLKTKGQDPKYKIVT